MRVSTDPIEAADEFLAEWQAGHEDEVIETLLTLPISFFAYFIFVLADAEQEVAMVVAKMEGRTAGFRISGVPPHHKK